MAHAIWEDNMTYVGEMPWHGIGKQVADTITGEELKETLNLSQVALRPLFTYGMDGSIIKVTDKVATLRTKDNIVVGVVGTEFNPLQDADLIDTLDTLRVEGLCAFETAGLLKGGSRFFVSLKVPNGLLRLKTPNGKEDLVLQYLLVSHGHDGSLKAQIDPTNIRTVCQNTLSAARQEAEGQGISFAIKHTLNAENRVQAAIAAYQAGMSFHRDFAEYAQIRVNTPFSAAKMKQLAESMFPTPEGKESDIPAGVLKGRYELQRLFVEGKGHEELALVGTAWGAYNAVTEYLDWQRPTRGDKEKTEAEIKAKKWEASQFSPQVIERKQFALAEIEKLVAA
jgi:phage/plasmid-like protein (TIGR03299 family)